MNETDHCNKWDRSVQIALAIGVPLALCAASNLWRDTSFSQAFFELIGGPAFVATMILLAIADLVLDGDGGFQLNRIELALLMLASIGCRAYLFWLTIKYARSYENRKGFHFFNLVATFAFAFIGIAFIGMRNQ